MATSGIHQWFTRTATAYRSRPSPLPFAKYTLPSPWTDSDVGSPALAGSAGYSGGVFTVNGAGADIWGTSDQFNYVSQPLSGNGTTNFPPASIYL